MLVRVKHETDAINSGGQVSDIEILVRQCVAVFIRPADGNSLPEFSAGSVSFFGFV
jgi:hypothetical protein